MANKNMKSQSGTTTRKSSGTSTQTGSSTYGQNQSNTKNYTKTGNGSFTSSGKGTGQKTLKHVFEKCLQDIYSAEKQMIEALPRFAKAAESEDLQDAFTDHLNQTKRHADRIEKICSRLGIEKDKESCKAMEGLIEECDGIISEFEESAVRDSALIIGVQKAEHYEMALYGSLSELADVLGYHKEADLLDRTLEEEEHADHLLTDIAMDINDEACMIGEDQQQMKEEEEAAE